MSGPSASCSDEKSGLSARKTPWLAMCARSADSSAAATAATRASAPSSAVAAGWRRGEPPAPRRPRPAGRDRPRAAAGPARRRPCRVAGARRAQPQRRRRRDAQRARGAGRQRRPRHGVQLAGRDEHELALADARGERREQQRVEPARRVLGVLARDRARGGRAAAAGELAQAKRSAPQLALDLRRGAERDEPGAPVADDDRGERRRRRRGTRRARAGRAPRAGPPGGGSAGGAGAPAPGPLACRARRRIDASSSASRRVSRRASGEPGSAARARRQHRAQLGEVGGERIVVRAGARAAATARRRGRARPTRAPRPAARTPARGAARAPPARCRARSAPVRSSVAPRLRRCCSSTSRPARSARRAPVAWPSAWRRSASACHAPTRSVTGPSRRACATASSSRAACARRPERERDAGHEDARVERRRRACRPPAARAGARGARGAAARRSRRRDANAARTATCSASAAQLGPALAPEVAPRLFGGGARAAGVARWRAPPRRARGAPRRARRPSRVASSSSTARRALAIASRARPADEQDVAALELEQRRAACRPPAAISGSAASRSASACGRSPRSAATQPMFWRIVAAMRLRPSCSASCSEARRSAVGGAQRAAEGVQDAAVAQQLGLRRAIAGPAHDLQALRRRPSSAASLRPSRSRISACWECSVALSPASRRVAQPRLAQRLGRLALVDEREREAHARLGDAQPAPRRAAPWRSRRAGARRPSARRRARSRSSPARAGRPTRCRGRRRRAPRRARAARGRARAAGRRPRGGGPARRGRRGRRPVRRGSDRHPRRLDEAPRARVVAEPAAQAQRAGRDPAGGEASAVVGAQREQVLPLADRDVRRLGRDELAGRGAGRRRRPCSASISIVSPGASNVSVRGGALPRTSSSGLVDRRVGDELGELGGDRAAADRRASQATRCCEIGSRSLMARRRSSRRASSSSRGRRSCSITQSPAEGPRYMFLRPPGAGWPDSGCGSGRCYRRAWPARRRRRRSSAAARAQSIRSSAWQRAESLRERAPQRRVALLGEQPGVGQRGGTLSCGQAVVLGRHDAGLLAQHAQALVARGRGQPAAQRLGVAQVVEVLEQAHPRRLEDVGRVGVGEAVAARGGPDDARVARRRATPTPRARPARADRTSSTTSTGLTASPGWRERRKPTAPSGGPAPPGACVAPRDVSAMSHTARRAGVFSVCLPRLHL